LRVALKVDVLTREGACRGMPALLELFDTYGVRASFACAVGPGAGPAWRRLLQLEPPLHRLAFAQWRAAIDAGHEVGVAAYDVRGWLRNAAHAGAETIVAAVGSAVEGFAQATGRAPEFFASAGWQVHPQLFTEEAIRGWRWASDTRGRYPYLPALQGVRSTCVQIPTTLPTLDEVLRSGAATAARVHEYLYAESRHVLPTGHVYSASAEREGGPMLAVMEKLIIMWKGYDGTLRSLGQVAGELATAQLPVHQVGWGELPGRAGHLAMQSVEVPR
jgi:peptidoglycan/xylan/chitin deacetylase (PgdA/CDA1 family)